MAELVWEQLPKVGATACHQALSGVADISWWLEFFTLLSVNLALFAVNSNLSQRIADKIGLKSVGEYD